MPPRLRQIISFLLPMMAAALLASSPRSAASAFEGSRLRLIATPASSLLGNANDIRGGGSSGRDVDDLLGDGTEATAAAAAASRSGSNSTHVVWIETTTMTRPPPSSSSGARVSVRVQDRVEAERECMSYLRRNLMEYDVPNLGSLGFPTDEEDEGAEPEGRQSRDGRRSSNGDEASGEEEDDDDEALPDGLSDGLVGPTVSLSLDAKSTYPWTDRLPREIFMEYVLSFSHLNEGRSNWRPLLRDAIKPAIDRLLLDRGGNDDGGAETLTVEEVVMAVNGYLWTEAFPHRPITFKAGHTPLIYDPMSVLAFGYASCTGLSVFLACALRAAGVAARVAGTAAWHGEEEEGNHSWVEVFDPDDGGDGGDGSGGSWKITEALQDGQLTDPCRYWFCNKDRFDGRTKVHAARLVRDGDGDGDGVGGEVEGEEAEYFPMAWDPNNRGVPAEDRTEAMMRMCAGCSTSAKERGL